MTLQQKGRNGEMTPLSLGILSLKNNPAWPFLSQPNKKRRKSQFWPFFLLVQDSPTGPESPDELDSDLEDKIKLDAVAEVIGQDQSSKGNQALQGALGALPPRWRNWVIRGIFTWVMIGGFGLIIYGGPLALVLTTLAVQVKCFAEIINIGYAVYR